MILKGKIVTLRPIEFEDLEFIRNLINDPEMEKTIVGWAWPVSKKDEEQWFSAFKNSESALRYIIETEADGVVGLTGLVKIDWKNGTAKGAGIRIKRDIQSKGVATDAYMTMLKYAFKELRLHRVSTAAFDDNVASLRFQEKCGLKKEGVIRESVYKNGKYKNVVVLGIIDREYDELIEKNHYWD
jgi:RimJ/RimL family protein N-acetyltransferase